MVEVEVLCSDCATTVWMRLAAMVLRRPAASGRAGELMFECLVCRADNRLEVGAETVVSLRLLGARTLTLQEPAATAGGQSPPGKTHP